VSLPGAGVLADETAVLWRCWPVSRACPRPDGWTPSAR